MATPKFTNNLIDESSPYLLQHAHNPVNWEAWNTKSLEKARKENKLLLISVGYSACHWCHVMEHESFEDEAVAALMNEHFINIKVDREERPDVDQVYMNAIQVMTGAGGWPMNIVALPDGRPVWGGTYFRKEQWKDALKIADRISVIYMGSIIGTISKSEANLNQNKILNLMLGNYDNQKTNSFLENETQKILNTVFKATEFLTSNYELKDVLKLLAEYSSDFTKADNCVIKLIDENTKSFIETFKYESNKKIVSEIKKEKLFEVTRDEKIFFITEDDREFDDIFSNKSINVKLVIVIPVLIRPHVSGII